MSDSTFSSGGAAAPPPYYPSDQKAAGPKQGLGCFVWGCLAVVAVGIVGTTAMVGLGYYGLTKLRDMYTDTQPAALPVIQLNEEERRAVRTRFDGFRAAVDQGSATEAFELTEDDLNSLIAESDPNDPMTEALRVEIEGDRIVGQLSLPMDQFGLPMLRGRYLNGTADLVATLENGVLDVRIESATVKGEPLPNEFMTELRRENLAAKAMTRPDVQRTLQNLDSIEIRDDRLILIPKAQASTAPPASATDDAGGEL